MLVGLRRIEQSIEDRGPRYAVVGTIRQGEFCIDYTDTAERAEALADDYRDGRGYRQVVVHPPAGSIDLVDLGHARARAKSAYDGATAVLRAAVLRAYEEGRAETEIARRAGVDRATVRKWIGK